MADYFFKEIKKISPTLKFGGFIFLLLIPNGIILWALIRFIATQQSSTVGVFKEFLKMSFSSSQFKWFYAVKYLLAILTNKTEMILWVSPERYMHMHTACAILARQHYYSFFKAPDWLWTILRNNGGDEYKREVGNIYLKEGKRYVLKENEETPHACSDFENIKKLECVLIDSTNDNLESIPDFSAFDVGNGYICLKIKEEDRIRVMAELGKLKTVQRDIALPKLRKIKFRAYIEISHDGLPSWIKTACETLTFCVKGMGNNDSRMFK